MIQFWVFRVEVFGTVCGNERRSNRMNSQVPTDSFEDVPLYLQKVHFPGHVGFPDGI